MTGADHASTTASVPPPESGATDVVAPSAQRRPSSGRRLLRELGLIVVIAVVVAALLRAFVVQAFMVPTGSMRNTILKHQRIVVQKFGEIERGEVVVFEDPGGWISPAEVDVAPPNPLERALQFVGVMPSTATNHLVKRVIGLPGDTVACCDRQDRLTINGAPLDESAYLFPGDVPSLTDFKVVVPRDTLWVMGDHRSDSGDSRCHVDDGTAFVPFDLVTGRAFAVAWPLDEANWLQVPEAFAAVPAGDAPPAQAEVARPPDC